MYYLGASVKQKKHQFFSKFFCFTAGLFASSPRTCAIASVLWAFRCNPWRGDPVQSTYSGKINLDFKANSFKNLSDTESHRI